MTRATNPGAHSSHAHREPIRARDRWRTIRTITCELRALTGPAQPAGFGRPLAGPEVLVPLPSFQGQLLRGAVVPVRPPTIKVASLAAPPRILAPVTPAQPSVHAPSFYAWLGPVLLFAITGLLLGAIVALASG